MAQAHKRSKKTVEDDEFLAFALRVVRAYARRAGSDVEAVASLSRLAREADAAVDTAIIQLKNEYSCAEIAQRLGVTRQAVQKRGTP